MKKILFILLVMILTFLTSCEIDLNKKENDIDKEKPITGIEPIFNEALGYYNEYPCVVQTNQNELYLFYTRNLEKFNNKTDSIAVRRAVLTDGKWVYGKAKTLITLSEAKTAWDHKYLSSPDVIKGEFKYNGETYYYLMAYAGSNYTNRMNSQIGFAVSKTIDGEYIKVGDKPVIAFDQSAYSETGLANYKGAQEPSLISYDKKGKIQLYYSFYGSFNHSYMVEMDCSDLNNIKMGGRMLSEVDGLSDSTTNTHLYSADFAYNPVNDELIAVRNFSSTTTGLPAVAEAIQVVYANINRAFYDVNYANQESDEANVWWLCNTRYYKIGAIKTADDSSSDLMKSSGYYRVYNATLFSDEYGWVNDPSKIEVIFTSTALNDSQYLEGDEYKFSQMLHYYSFDFTRDEED